VFLYGGVCQIIEILRSSKDVAEGKSKITAQFQLTEVQVPIIHAQLWLETGADGSICQADAITALRLSRLTTLESNKLTTECSQLETDMKQLQSWLQDDAQILRVMKEETKQLMDKYGEDRRTKIVFGTETGTNHDKGLLASSSSHDDPKDDQK
jgi:DNA gyrase subunit A